MTSREQGSLQSRKPAIRSPGAVNSKGTLKAKKPKIANSPPDQGTPKAKKPKTANSPPDQAIDGVDINLGEQQDQRPFGDIERLHEILPLMLELGGGGGVSIQVQILSFAVLEEPVGVGDNGFEGDGIVRTMVYMDTEALPISRFMLFNQFVFGFGDRRDGGDQDQEQVISSFGVNTD